MSREALRREIGTLRSRLRHKEIPLSHFLSDTRLALWDELLQRRAKYRAYAQAYYEDHTISEAQYVRGLCA